MLKDIEAAIFDLDGTLIDSMWVWEQIDIDYLASKGIPLPSNLKDEIGHLSFEQTAVYFKSKFNLDDSLIFKLVLFYLLTFRHSFTQQFSVVH